MMGNGGIYHEGWSAFTRHRTPWITGITALPRFTEDRWELHDGERDESQCDDLAGSMHGKLEELKQLWLIEAAKYQVVPIDDRPVEPVTPEPLDEEDESHRGPTDAGLLADREASRKDP